MPSRLATMPRRYDPNGVGMRAREIAVNEPQPVQLAPVWGGYTPDLSPRLSTWADLASVTGFMPRNTALAPPTGFARVVPTGLPLQGGDEPIVGLPTVLDIQGPSPTVRRFVVTADPTLGHLTELRAGVWTDIPYAGGGAGFSGDSSGAGISQTLCDSTYFPSGDALILANGHDPVYTHTPGGASYTDFSPALLNPFLARSCATYAERVFFLATNEGGTAFPNRLRGTTRSATPSLSGVGSVLVTFDEAGGGQGVAVRQIGNYLACYFSHSIAFCRETGNLLVPLTREYVTRARGLLGTFSVADIGGGVHFAMCTDGWFLLDSNGSFREVGLREIDGARYPKWRDTFYNSLNTSHLNRITTAYDATRRGVFINWPSQASDGTPDRLWFYHLDTDSVWPLDNIFAVGVPNVLAESYSVASTEVTYATVATTYATESGAYADYEQVEGEPIIAAGTRSGLVFHQNSGITTVDGDPVQFSAQTVRHHLGEPASLTTLEKIALVYRKQLTANTVTVGYYDEDSGIPQQFNPRTANPGQIDTDYVHAQRTAAVHAFGVSGTHPFELISAQPYITRTGAPPLKLR